MIPLNSAALAEIMRRPREGPYVFPAARGEGPTVGLYKTWDRAREAAKLEGVRLHDLRHSFASFITQLLGDRDQTHAVLGELPDVELELELVAEEPREAVHHDHVEGGRLDQSRLDHRLE